MTQSPEAGVENSRVERGDVQMKGLFCIILSYLVVCTAWGTAGEVGHAKHYTLGVSGLQAASMPPPNPKGFFWRQYHVFYNADKRKDNSGNTAAGDFDVSVYGFVNRFIYSSDIKFLGGNILFDTIIPVTSTDMSLKMGAATLVDAKKTGLGDISITPLNIAWHGDQWDAVVAFTQFLPTGSFSANRPVNPGKGFYTFMFTTGFTYYFDRAKNWHASILSRYEVHTKQKETNVRHGQDYQFEWGVGRKIGKYLDAGVSGYWHRQLTYDSGVNASQTKQQVQAIGPELAFVIPKWKFTGSIRSLWEFNNKNASQGNMTVVTFTKIF